MLHLLGRHTGVGSFRTSRNLGTIVLSRQSIRGKQLIVSSSFSLVASVLYDSDRVSRVASLYYSLPAPATKRPYRRPGTYQPSSAVPYNPMQAKTDHRDGLMSRLLLTILCWCVAVHHQSHPAFLHRYQYRYSICHYLELDASQGPLPSNEIRGAGG